jgi:hypothetical protein
MVNRVVSLSVLLCVVAVLIWGTLSPSYPLFLFISPDKWLSIARLLFASFMVLASFTSVFNSSELRKITYRMGMGMIGLGAFLLLLTQVQASLFDYFKPLDLLLLVEAGVILSSTSLAPASDTKKPARQLSLSLKTAKAVK